MTMSVAKLVAALTPLDERVLEAVAYASPASTDAVVRALYPVSTRSAGATPDQAREVLEVLRGLERAECVRERAGEWRFTGQTPPRPRAKRRRRR